jgi:hypothetical protein
MTWNNSTVKTHDGHSRGRDFWDYAYEEIQSKRSKRKEKKEKKGEK